MVWACVFLDKNGGFVYSIKSCWYFIVMCGAFTALVDCMYTCVCMYEFDCSCVVSDYHALFLVQLGI